MSAAITPFRIDIPQNDLDDLHRRLDATRWPAPLPGDDWDTGVPTGWLREMVAYWRDGYDWRAAERRLNEFPQFTTEIDGQLVHFVHVRSPEPTAFPLILTHGWPGSIVEFLDMIGPLTDPRAHGADPADAFHVVIPSLPGFGFSGPVADSGWTVERIAVAWAELMARLGYERYGAQGGDFGGAVSPELGRVAPERVAGVHVNGGVGDYLPLPLPEEELATLTELERDRVRRTEAFMQEEFGYISIQSTRPQTLAYGLVDSPVAQLAWIMDKFREWTHPRAVDPDKILDRDRLLTNVMLYWLTGTAGTAAYVGYAQDAPWGAEKQNSGVPTGVIVFAHDVAIRKYAGTADTITRWIDVDRGGHFAALEEPVLLASDMREFFGDLR
ncbi:epoxide hydrolase [Nocardia cyriacigeorgica]|uniref:Epoxide hydrolase n=1 Tax=Nocardia cyriacigeorgica TaxID=135487 RepID=A0ABX0CLK4_9NOCA|nr:epoxide hydrolase family protein [Nocardia cyriacigeorgica]NEW41325.1 epoxide hydrolase [Nocardia cyriacigeorgica]NEW57394.1 epoxide hydrolase [Nocardia cyriacigeorgica]